MMVVLGFLFDTNDVVVEAGDAMDVDVTSSRSSTGASKTGTLSSCAGITRCDSKQSNVTGNRGTTTWDSRRFRRKAEAKEGTGESSSVVTSAASLVWV